MEVCEIPYVTRLTEFQIISESNQLKLSTFSLAMPKRGQPGVSEPPGAIIISPNQLPVAPLRTDDLFQLPTAPKSKRVSGHKKYKIERKVKEHRKKEKKNAAAKEKRPRGLKDLRGWPERRSSRLTGLPSTLNIPGSKKDPGIPNTFPFKGELMEQIQEKKAKVGMGFSRPRSGSTDQRTSSQFAQIFDSMAMNSARRNLEPPEKSEWHRK
jgi:nuclear GTP-binding protein